MEASALRSGPLLSPSLGPLRKMASDERLVAGVRAGRRDAFEAIYDRYHRQLLSFCRHMLGSREEAEDAVQHAFAAAYDDLARSEKAIQLRPWLYAIARNHCLSLLRARREHVSIDDVEPAVEGLAPAVARREDLRELLRDLARLPDDQRAALLLSELGALSHEQIAGVIGCPQGKVKALVFQARSSLAAGREARTTPCVEIREQLATLTGGSLRRGGLRRHLRDCAGCREFHAEVRRQRLGMAVLLPVVPTAALRTGVMSSVAVKAGAVGGAGIGASAAGAGGGAIASSGGLGAALANLGAAKLLVAGAIAVGSAGGLAAAVTAIGDNSSSKRSTTPSSQGHTRGRSSDGSTPAGVTPTRAHGEQAPGKQSGGVANGKNAKGAHGRSETAPGHTGTSPGLAGTAPGKSGAAPGRAKAHGNPGSTPGGARPHGTGKSGGGHAPSAPSRGGAGSPPGQTVPSHGNSGRAPGRTGTPGNSGNAPVDPGAGLGKIKPAGDHAGPAR